MSDTTDPAASRRAFLFKATGCAGCVAAGAAALPLVDQMNPAADTRAAAELRVDLSAVLPGTQLTVQWQGRPVFIRRRTAEDIAAARAVRLSDLPDPLANNANLPADAPATDANRALDAAGEWLVMMGVCTHLGCVPLGGAAGDFGGWFCPCHGSHYDSAGRIRRGPAPRNLPVPRAVLLDPVTLQIGVGA
ncbi:ubiquinol-cytochrome c reductase iron-sulfur subunit [Falsirhodobacter algicola]|uniref:Ubiquinol-cytochrome c reductase iron-sulfur subunit n=1 Tax=Falsirhodobacter algicola TaxID=2692330 RepID=A0A8J8MTE7_9RHOB|nr:ubiquinol-cytochrome c reductase iron-sulfur subunit [Falsirhodobacter algicola]QUS36390.1 ubiquinol-cytochrome c reductase iron-sulfur subunit [Falsirhodobacter algicola]